MSTTNGKMTISCPEGFQELDAAERAKFRSIDGPPEVCFRDSDRQMIVCASHRKLPLLARAVLNDREIVSSMEKNVSNAMAANDYKLIGFSERDVGGKTGNCFRCNYVAEGISMASEACFVRDGSMVYNLYVYYRLSRESESLYVWESILNSIIWMA